MNEAAARVIELTEKNKALFWAKVDKNGPMIPGMKTACWLWTANKRGKGYGSFRVSGRTLSTHRIAWVLMNGQIPDNGSYHGICVCHKCDVRNCCNPEHLFLGTQMENVEDKDRKGRGNYPTGDNHHSRLHPERLARGDASGSRLHPEKRPRGDAHPARLHPERLARGEANGNTKLTAVQVVEIRSLYAAGGITQRSLGMQFGVSQAPIRDIINRKRWRHI
jgi:sugar (pentulose or hexulose) kinase